MCSWLAAGQLATQMCLKYKSAEGIVTDKVRLQNYSFMYLLDAEALGDDEYYYQLENFIPSKRKMALLFQLHLGKPYQSITISSSKPGLLFVCGA